MERETYKITLQSREFGNPDQEFGYYENYRGRCYHVNVEGNLKAARDEARARHTIKKFIDDILGEFPDETNVEITVSRPVGTRI